MKRQFITSLLGTLLLTIPATAQESKIYTYDLKRYDKALELYNDNLYLASQKTFRAIKTSFDNSNQYEGNCAYYIAASAIRLDQEGSDKLMDKFIAKYPLNPHINRAKKETADYYYQATKYALAIKWYQKVDLNSFTPEEQEDYNFKIGYALYSTGNYEQSKKYFNQIIDSETYGAQAKYYYGHSAYSQKDYDTADEYLAQVSQNKNYKNDVSYSLVDINFKLGRFEKAIELGEPLLAKVKGEEHSQVSKIVGESYFNLEKHEEASKYLEGYKGTNGKWNNTDYYILGICYFKQNKYEKALTNFNKIVDADNRIAQNAYYHLGECYLEQKKYPEALNAFKSASQMEYDLKIQEEAYLNYAKLSYNVGNPYQSVPEVLKDYLKKYPNSEHQLEIENLLVNAYINAQDYQGAIKHLEKQSASKRNNTLYQKACFYRGIELFNQENYEEAITQFEKAKRISDNLNMAARSIYWVAESNYRLNYFDKALADFKTFYKVSNKNRSPEYDLAHYSLGYTYFKLKDYKQATKEFKSFLEITPKESNKYLDAQLRLADTYYVTKSYKKAVLTYDKVANSNSSEADYATFQKAISYGYLKENSKKIFVLNSLIQKFPESRFRDESYFVLSKEYIKKDDSRSAIKNLDALIENTPKSNLVPKAFLNKGIIYYNQDQNTEAIAAYKDVVKYFPNSPEAHQAINSARQIYMDEGKVDEYAAWVKTVDFVETKDSDIDNYTYQAAEREYLESNFNTAITRFEKYNKQFPNGIHKVKANFYLAQSYFSLKELDKAIPSYKIVIDSEANEYTEQALSRISQAYLEADDWDNAIPNLIALEQQSKSNHNTIFAQSNLMKAYYNKENYSDAVNYADKVLNNNTIDDQVKSDATIIIARSAFKTDDFSKSKQAYKQVESIASGKLVAEALYYSAYFSSNENKYEESNATIQKLVANYSSYKSWGGKSLIIMAKNNYALEDSFQATYILENVIKNFSQYDDIVDEASKLLNEYKEKEAQTNESIIPESN